MSTFLNRFNRPPASVSLASASQHVEDYSPWVTPPRTRGGPASTSDATTHDEGVAALVALLRSTPSLINTVRSIVHAPADTLTRSNSSDLWSDEGGEEVSACASHSDQVILLTPSKLVGAFDSTEVLREVGNGPTDSLGTVVLIKKHERLLLKGTNRDDQKILALIGKGLETKFGVTRHFIVGQTEEAADSKKYEHIQVLAAKNMAGVKKLRVHAEKYDMMDILIVPEVTDPSDLSLPPAAVFTLDTKHDLLKDWMKISYERICCVQKFTNTSRYIDPADADSSKHLLTFVWDSCTESLLLKIEERFNKLPDGAKGGLTFLWLLLNTVFQMSLNTIKGYKDFLTLYGEKGPSVFGHLESFAVGGPQLAAVVYLLASANKLPSEASLYILQGGAKCSNKLLRDLCDKERLVEAARRMAAWDPTTDIDSQDSIQKRAEAHIEMCMECYQSELANGGQFATPHKPSDVRLNALTTPGGGAGGKTKCFNCEEFGCDVAKCSKPKDQARITANRKKFLDAKAASKSPGGGGGAATGTVPTRTSGQPSTKKFGNVTKTMCTKCGGYSDTHSTKYHSIWKQEGAAFNLAKLCPTHPLIRHNGDGTGGGGSSSGGSAVDKTKAVALLAGLEKTAATERDVQTIAALRLHLGF